MSRQVLLGVALLAIPACAGTSRGPVDIPLRVATYNIQAGGGNLDSIASAIRSLNADVVGLEEVDVHWGARSGFADQAAQLATKLGMQARFAPIYHLQPADPSAPAREYGVAVLSRYPIVSFRNAILTRLSTQDSSAGPMPMPGMVDAVLNVDGQRVRVLVTHLDYRADPAVRIRQVRETLDYLAESKLPTILTGDLNATPDAPELQPLFKGLRDSWSTASDPGLTYPATKPVKRIDYVLTSAHFTPRHTSVLPILASDHRPVVAELLLRRAR